MTRREHSVLIVDDEPVICDLLVSELGDRGYGCATAQSAGEALASLMRQRFDVALVDIKLPGVSGMELLEEMRRKSDLTPTIMITGINDIDAAVRAIRLGASDYLVKPLDMRRLLESIRAALDDGEEDKGTGVGNEEVTLAQELMELDAVAFGLEVKYDFLLGFSETVTRETVEAARGLGISQTGIQKWEACRTLLDSESRKRVESCLARLRRSPLAGLLRRVRVPWETRIGCD